jgi:hypothetical protein
LELDLTIKDKDKKVRVELWKKEKQQT